MHNLRTHASLPYRETSRKAVWRHNQLPEVSLVYFARSTSKVRCGYSETMLCVFPACFAKCFPHGCYEAWDHQMTLTMSRQLLTEEVSQEWPYDLCCREFREGIPPLRLYGSLELLEVSICNPDLKQSVCWTVFFILWVRLILVNTLKTP